MTSIRVQRGLIILVLIALSAGAYLSFRTYQSDSASHRQGSGPIQQEQLVARQRIQALTAERERLMAPDSSLPEGQTWSSRLADLERIRTRWMRREDLEPGEMDRLNQQIAEARTRLRSLPGVQQQMATLSNEIQANQARLAALTKKSDQIAQQSKKKFVGKLWIAGGGLLLLLVLLSLMTPGKQSVVDGTYPEEAAPDASSLNFLPLILGPATPAKETPFPSGPYPGGWQNVAHPSQAKLVEKCHYDGREIVNELYTFSAEPPPRIVPRLVALLESVESLPAGAHRKLVRLSRADRRKSLADHVLRVTWMSLLRAERLKLNKDDMLLLGLAGFFHDLGRVPWQNQPDHLVPSDIFRQTAQLLERIPDLDVERRKILQAIIGRIGPEGEKNPLCAILSACHFEEPLRQQLALGSPTQQSDLT